MYLPEEIITEIMSRVDMTIPEISSLRRVCKSICNQFKYELFLIVTDSGELKLWGVHIKFTSELIRGLPLRTITYADTIRMMSIITSVCRYIMPDSWKFVVIKECRTNQRVYIEVP